MQLSNLPIVSLLGGQPLINEESVCLEVYVADHTAEGDLALFYDAWVNNVARELCRFAGGCTAYSAKGLWLGKASGRIQEDGVTVLRCYVGRSTLSANATKLRQVLVQYGQECEQEAVGFSLNGEFFTINPKDGY